MTEREERRREESEPGNDKPRTVDAVAVATPFIIVVVLLVWIVPKAWDAFSAWTEDIAAEPTPTRRTPPTPIVWMPVTAHEIITTYKGNVIAGHHEYANSLWR